MTHPSFEPGGQSSSVRASKADPGVVAGQVEALADVLMEHSQVHESEQNADNQSSIYLHVFDHRLPANTHAC